MPSNGTDKLFIGSTLILFSLACSFKQRYFCTREKLLAMVLLAKEKVGNSNLLYFYIDRVNRKKGINKYLKDVVKDPNLDKYADLIIEYLNQFKLDFISTIKKKKSFDKYTKSLEEKGGNII